MNPKLLEAKDLADTEPDYAIRLCNEVLNDDFENGPALFIQGYIFLQAEKYGLAYHIFKRCVDLAPGKSEIYSNMGLACQHQYANREKALNYFHKALELDPGNYKAMANIGMCYMEMGHPKKAINWCNKALQINPESRSAHSNRGCAYLMDRQWEKGWKDFHWGLGGKWRQKREYGTPDWDGVTRGTIVVYGEQGLGDEILFSSIIPDLQKTNDVIIDCTDRLEGLFKRSFNCPVYGTRYADSTPIMDNPIHDFQISMGELPMYFRNKHKDFPGTSYLVADSERRLQWRALLETFPGKKIGLAWTGGLANTNRKGRSFALSALKPLFDSNHTFISLEYNEPDKEELERYNIKHWHRAVGKGVDYDETMALINELDLVISVTTTVVHGAGALGIPCWCLVPEHPSFRFHLSGDIPWHKSVKLFRQKPDEDWSEVVKRIKEKLVKEFPNE